MRELDSHNRRSVLKSIGSVGLATVGMGALSSQTVAAEELLYEDGPKKTWSYRPSTTVDQFGPADYTAGQSTVISFYGCWENDETDAFEPEFSVTTCASVSEGRDIAAHYVSAEGGDGVNFRYAARPGLTLHAYPENGDRPNMGDFSAEVIKQAVEQIPGMDFIMGYRDLLDAYTSQDDWSSDPDSVSYESPWFGAGEPHVSHTMWFRPTIQGDSGTVTVTSGITTRQDGHGTTEVTEDFTVGRDYAVVQRNSSYYR